MSKARAQSSKRKTQRTLFGLRKERSSTKINSKKLQIICEVPIKKKGRKSNSFKIREKWLKTLPFFLGKQKFIYHNK